MSWIYQGPLIPKGASEFPGMDFEILDVLETDNRDLIIFIQNPDSDTQYPTGPVPLLLFVGEKALFSSTSL